MIGSAHAMLRYSAPPSRHAMRRCPRLARHGLQVIRRRKASSPVLGMPAASSASRALPGPVLIPMATGTVHCSAPAEQQQPEPQPTMPALQKCCGCARSSAALPPADHGPPCSCPLAPLQWRCTTAPAPGPRASAPPSPRDGCDPM